LARVFCSEGSICFKTERLMPVIRRLRTRPASHPRARGDPAPSSRSLAAQRPGSTGVRHSSRPQPRGGGPPTEGRPTLGSHPPGVPITVRTNPRSSP
jgi:hypothetical protein